MATSQVEMVSGKFAIVDGTPRVFFQVPEPKTPGSEAGGVLRVLIDASGSMGSVWPSLATAVNKLTSSPGVKDAGVITFSNDAYVVPLKNGVPKLSQNIGDHHSSGTAIIPGVNALMRELHHVCGKGGAHSPPVSVLFISDGEDTTTSVSAVAAHIRSVQRPKGAAINALTWGVGAGFPTTLAMSLRERLHSGPANSPPVFLLENKTQVTEQCDTIASFLSFQRTKLSPAARLQPWDAEGNVSESFSGSWVSYPLPSEVATAITSSASAPLSDAAGSSSTPSSQSFLVCMTITVNGVHTAVHAHPMDTASAMAIFKQWTSALQLLSMGSNLNDKDAKRDVRTVARTALTWMQAIKAQAEANEAAAGKAATSAKPTVLRRLQKALKGAVLDMQTFIREVTDLEAGSVLEGLSDEAKAQRLKIGTVQGAYHSRALKFRGLEASEFESMKEQFLKVLEAHPLPADYTTGQDPSAVTLETLADVLREPDLAEAIRTCPDAFHLVEAFPIVGAGLQLARSDGSMINSWLVGLRAVARTAASVDSLALLAADPVPGAGPNSLKLSTGVDPETGEAGFEVVNAVLPLFDAEKDAPLAPLLRTRLVQLLVHFQVVGNVDTFDASSYLGALASAHWWLVAQQPPSAWRDAMVKRVLDTVAMVYGDGTGAPGTGKDVYWRAYLASLQKDWQHGAHMTLVTDHPSNAVPVEVANADGSTRTIQVSVKCEGLAKPFLALAILARTGRGPTGPQRKEYARRLVCEMLGRAFSANASIPDRPSSLQHVFKYVPPAPGSVDPETAALLAAAQTHITLRAGAFECVRLLRQDVERAVRQAVQEAKDAAKAASAAKHADADATGPHGHDELMGRLSWKFDDEFVRKNVFVGPFNVGAITSVLQEPLHTAGLTRLAVHALKFSNSQDRNSPTVPLPTLQEALSSACAELDARNQTSPAHRAAEALIASRIQEWRDVMAPCHKAPRPFTPASLLDECRRLSGSGDGSYAMYKDLTQATLGETLQLARSGLVRNACCCTGCPFYLLPMHSSVLYEHLSVLAHRSAYMDAMRTAGSDAARAAALEDAVLERVLDAVEDGKQLRPSRSAAAEARSEASRAFLSASDATSRQARAEIKALARELLRQYYAVWSQQDVEAVTAQAASAPVRR